MTPREIVLLHSPLVGATSLWPSAHELERRGWPCRVPSPASENGSTPWREWAARLAVGLGGADRPILAAHSAAGLLLPSLAAATNASMLLFVDARMPPARGRVAPADPAFRRFIDTLPLERGRLPPWSRWWGDDRLQQVIADAQMRAQFESDLPRLPRTWFDDTAAVPPWRARRCGYLRLSNTYAAEARDAADRGWPVIEVDGTHLDPATEPHRTVDALLDLIDRIDPSAAVDGENQLRRSSL